MKADGRQRTPVLATAGHVVCCTMADSIRTLQHSLNSRPSLRHFEAKVTQAIVEPEMCFQKAPCWCQFHKISAPFCELHTYHDGLTDIDRCYRYRGFSTAAKVRLTSRQSQDSACKSLVRGQEQPLGCDNDIVIATFQPDPSTATLAIAPYAESSELRLTCSSSPLPHRYFANSSPRSSGISSRNYFGRSRINLDRMACCQPYAHRDFPAHHAGYADHHYQTCAPDCA